MSTLRLAGTLWIMAGVVCAGLLSFVLIGEHINDLGALLANLALPARVLGGALVAFLIGGLLLTRPGPNVVRSSSLAGRARIRPTEHESPFQRMVLALRGLRTQIVRQRIDRTEPQPR